MGNITSVKLRLAMLEGGAGYSVTLKWVEGGMEKTVEEPLPLDLKLAPYTDDYNTYPSIFIQGGEKAKFSDIGRHLFTLLHTGQVGQQWDKLKKDKGNDESLRILLDIDERVALLPWELMLDGELRPFQDTEDTIVRVRGYDEKALNLKAEPISWPARVLVVVGVNDKYIKADKEVERIDEILHRNRFLDVEFCEPLTINDLEMECKKFRPHVFHYIGHGGVDGNGNAYLMLRNKDGKNDTWTANQIYTSLKAWGWTPRFAFINACRSETTEKKPATVTDQKNAWAIGDAFRKLSVPAVLTMQADVDGALAGEFAGILYDYLAGGEPIDIAIAAARIKMRDNTMGMNKDYRRDWGTPTLTLSIPPEQVLPLKLPSNNPRKKDIDDCKLFQEVSVLANRRSDRRLFIHAMYPIPPQQPDKELIFVHGGKKMGKTWITLWGLESYAWQGHDVRYVEVASGNSPKWLDVLMHIQTGDPSKKYAGKYPLIFKPLDAKAFNEFNHELPYRLRNEKPPAWGGQDVPPPEKLDTSELDNLPETTAEEIFKSFRKALVAAAEPNKPLIIVLDKFSDGGQGVTEPHMNKFLIPYLFEEAVAGDLTALDEDGVSIRSVKLVLVINDDEISMFTKNESKLTELISHSHEVPLEEIPIEYFEKVALEFFRNLKAGPKERRRLIENSTAEDAQSIIDRLRPRLGNKWTPVALEKMNRILEQLEQAH